MYFALLAVLIIVIAFVIGRTDYDDVEDSEEYDIKDDM